MGSGRSPLARTLASISERLARVAGPRQLRATPAAAPSLAALLAFCPAVHLLVTSRAALHLSGEYECAVQPLAVPDLAHLPDQEGLAEIATVALFLQRTQAIQPGFTLTSANASTIAELCARLEGLPLAIELAAARMKLLPPPALLKRLSHRLEVLTGGARDLPARQQTLRQTMQWSYDLLSTPEQRLFRWLSVFVGGCTLEAAAVVCTAEGDPRIEVLEGVASLIDKSLLHQTEREREEPHLVMLETIREFELERLAADREGETARDVQAADYLLLAEEAEPYFMCAEQGEWLDRLEREHENLRAALSWLIERDDRETALRLGGALWRFWWMHGHLSEGRGFLESMLPASNAVAASIRAKALVGAGVLTGAQGYYMQAETLCAEGLRLSRSSKTSEAWSPHSGCWEGSPITGVSMQRHARWPRKRWRSPGRRETPGASPLRSKSDLGCP